MSGATDTQVPKAQPAPAAPAAPSGNADGAVACASDADCQAVDGYCGSCQCLALASGAATPKCPGSEVQCFAAPCRGQRASCKAGACSLGAGEEQ
ncbi:MAG TPA: hypothetical protein VFN67_18965 [Polyangiales bacterium]|nr:hypothetical protein [Polyangiales bacterium]